VFITETRPTRSIHWEGVDFGIFRASRESRRRPARKASKGRRKGLTMGNEQ